MEAQEFKVGDRVYVKHYEEAGTIVKIYQLTDGAVCYRTKMDIDEGCSDQEGCLDWLPKYIRKPTPLEQLL